MRASITIQIVAERRRLFEGIEIATLHVFSERQFRSWLGMKIKLTSNDKGKGKLVIQFNSNDDFERIYQALKPHDN